MVVGGALSLVNSLAEPRVAVRLECDFVCSSSRLHRRSASTLEAKFNMTASAPQGAALRRRQRQLAALSLAEHVRVDMPVQKSGLEFDPGWAFPGGAAVREHTDTNPCRSNLATTHLR